jgi:molecular chaperone GrpE
MSNDETNPSPEEQSTSAEAAANAAAAEAGQTEEAVDDLAAMLTPEEQELITTRVERDDYRDTMQRLAADFDNFRKRALRDQDAAAERAGEKLINRLLPVLDTFEMALTHEADPDASPLAKMHDALLSALEAEGLERLAPQGESFDPSIADAVMHEDGDDTDGPIVAEVLRAGYRWKTKVVRPAMVKVKG